MKYNWLDEIIPKVSLPDCKKGDWEIAKFEVEDSLVYRFRERHFLPGTYTKLHHKYRGLIMSDTPAERLDHVDFVRHAHGSVLISGLGLGMCLGAVLKVPSVTDVTILEIEQDVIDLVAPHYKDDRVTIIHTNALEWKPPKGKKYEAVWHDIWDNICVDNKPEMSKLNRRYARKSYWKGCWGQDLIKDYC